MGGSYSIKYENIYKIMRDRNLVLAANLPDRLKCGSCKNILINSCQVPCGCKYCRHCIDKLVANGCRVCPGVTPFCNVENLSSFVTDYSANREILNVVVKCPEETCTHQCELLNIDDHMKLCLKKIVNCPFYGLGCDQENVVSDKLNDHLQSEIGNHNTILIDMINNVKNAVTSLRQDLLMKEERIAVLDDELKLLKIETRKQLETSQQNVENQIEILKQNLVIKDTQIAGMSGEMRSMKEENVEMAVQIEMLKRNSEDRFRSISEEMRLFRENTGPVSTFINEANKNHQMQIAKLDEKTNYIPGQTDKTIFTWNIDNVAKMRDTNRWNYSEYFSPANDRYQMRLDLIDNSDNLDICFCIDGGENDAEITWPFQGNVTIKITNKAQPDTFKSITKYCQIPKPNWLGLFQNNYSEPFKFSYEELSSDGLIQDNCFIIDCCVE